MRQFKAPLREGWLHGLLGWLFVLTIGAPSGNAVLSGKMVYDCDGSDDICVMNVDGTQRVRITDGQGINASPAWSPDGKQIAFLSNRDGDWDVYVINTDGTGLRRLTDNTARDASPDWSPDGKKIVYESESQIFVIDADGGKPTKLTQNAFQNGSPAWSPRGDKIAYGSNTQIWVMDADGANPLQLTEERGGCSEPAWSPGGTFIAYFRFARENSDIYMMRADGTDKSKLTKMRDTRETNPVWSPDGRQIAFLSMTKGLDPKRDGIYVMNADGSGEPQLLVLGFFNRIDWIDPGFWVSSKGKVPVIGGKLKRGF